jgi:hypothetical protein
MTNSEGNTTNCGIDTENSLSAISIAGDGMLLLLNIHGQLSLLA